MSLQRIPIPTILFILLLLVVLVACGSGTPADPTATTASESPASATKTPAVDEASSADTPTAATPIAASDAPTATPSATPEPVVTPEMVTVAHLDGSETTMEPLPPVGYLELLQRQVEAGEWTETEGIILLLKMLAGELDSEQAGIDTVVSESATDLIRHAHDVAQDPDTSAEEAAEIERLLNSLTPSQEALDLYSVPESELQNTDTESRRWQRLSRLQAQDDPCEDLVASGFPTDDVEGFPCFVYRETELNGFQYRVYYPRSWMSDGGKLALVDTAMAGLTESAGVFYELAITEDVNVVFSLRPYGDDNRWAHQAYFPPGEACPITLFPSANDRGDDSFKQIIAHEVFHCVQDWNFTTYPYKEHKWWMEGSAEYFSNVVYPTVNLEHRALGNFDYDSRTQSLMEMSYQNFIFFQYLANEIGDAALIALLETVSAAGDTGAQARVLANQGDMAGMFMDFAVSFMSEGIPDTGGGVIVIAHPGATRIEPVGDEEVKEFEVRPFVVARFGVSYEKEKRFLQEGIPGEGGRHSMVDNLLRRDKSAWSGVPPEVRSSCGDHSIYALVVTTVDNNYTFKIDVNTVEEAECDPCVLGTWEVDHQSFNEFITRVLAMSGAPTDISYSIQATGGRDLVQFMEDGRMATRRDAFQLTITSAEGPPIVYTVDSAGGGAYSADGEAFTFRDVVETTTRSTTTIGGFPMSVELNQQTANVTVFGHTSTVATDLPDTTSSSGLGTYVCTDDTLTLDMEVYGEIMFNRVDEILPTPVPTPAP